MTQLSKDYVDQTVVGAAGNVFHNGTVNQLAVIDQDVLVRNIDRVGLFVVLVDNVDTLGDTH